MNSNKPNPSLLHRGRLLANQLLAGAGISIIRTGKAKWVRDQPVVITKIGNYDLEIPSKNPLSKHYSSYPQCSANLGRLTSILRKKYPDLAGIDIGANVGDTACIMKSAEDIRLICIEGDKSTFGFLQRNLAQLRNVTAHNIFLGEKTETIQATFEKTGWNTTIIPNKKTTASSLEIITLDDFLATQTGVEKIKLLKIDTEGFDCAIIRGATKFIERFSPVITLEYNRENMDAIGENGLETLFKLVDFNYSHALFHDPYGRFFCSTKLTDKSLIRDFHDYADGKNGGIYYFDITLFHSMDSDIAGVFAATERANRVAIS